MTASHPLFKDTEFFFRAAAKSIHSQRALMIHLWHLKTEMERNDADHEHRRVIARVFMAVLPLLAKTAQESAHTEYDMKSQIVEFYAAVFPYTSVNQRNAFLNVFSGMNADQLSL